MKVEVIKESKSIKESVSSSKYSLNFGHWRTGNGKSFNSERELIEFLEDNYVENGTIVTQSQNVTDQFSKYFQHPPKDAHVSKEFFDRGYELIVNEKEELNEDITDTPIEDIEAFITEVKDRFPGSEAVYDGDMNTIVITLANKEE